MIELLVFLRDNYPNAYRTLLHAAGYKVQDNNQVLKGDEVINIEQLSIDKQKNLSGRLLRMRAKAKETDILYVLNGSAQPIPDEDSKKFTQLFTPIVKQFEEDQSREAERKKQEREERLAQEKPERERREREELIRLNRALLIQSGWDDDFPVIKPVKPNYSLSFDDYSKLLALNNTALSTQDLEYYIETESAFNLLKNRIKNSISAIDDLHPQTIEILVRKGVVDFSQAITYFLDHSEYKWREIEWLVFSLLQLEQFENLTTILNKTKDDGWSHCLQMEFNTITPLISFLKGRVPNDKLIHHVYWEQREKILKWMIENETDFQKRKAIIEFFFEKSSGIFSMELFTYLFNHNYFFKCIWPYFGRCLNEFNDNDINNMMSLARKTQAWEIATGIIRKHLNQQ